MKGQIFCSLNILSDFIYTRWNHLNFNFYKFSSNWIENESKKITFILTNNFDEKEVPLTVKDKINNFLGNNNSIISWGLGKKIKS